MGFSSCQRSSLPLKHSWPFQLKDHTWRLQWAFPESLLKLGVLTLACVQGTPYPWTAPQVHSQQNQLVLILRMLRQRKWWWSLLPVAKGGPYSCVRAQLLSCLSLCDPMDCSPPGSSVRGISQARILQWVAISFSRDLFWPRDQTCVSCISYIGRSILYHWATWEALHVPTNQTAAVHQVWGRGAVRICLMFFFNQNTCSL